MGSKRKKEMKFLTSYHFLLALMELFVYKQLVNSYRKVQPIMTGGLVVAAPPSTGLFSVFLTAHLVETLGVVDYFSTVIHPAVSMTTTDCHESPPPGLYGFFCYEVNNFKNWLIFA
jgi:hypothetical protein